MGYVTVFDQDAYNKQIYYQNLYMQLSDIYMSITDKLQALSFIDHGAKTAILKCDAEGDFKTTYEDKAAEWRLEYDGIISEFENFSNSVNESCNKASELASYWGTKVYTSQYVED